MVVEKSNFKIKCDASGCDELCCFRIVNKKFVFDGSVYLCDKCFNELYGAMGKYLIPKTIKPIYKKGGKDE